MTHTYKVSGMTCTGCQAKVEGLLSNVNGVKHVAIDLEKGEATIEMTQHVPTSDLKTALQKYPKYLLSEIETTRRPRLTLPVKEEKQSWLKTYHPILLVFSYILGVTLLIEFTDGPFLWMRWMNNFMGGFFLVFSFFKLLNLPAFAESYSMYDIVAKKWGGWGYVYAFIELALGIAFLTGFHPRITNGVTFLVMSVSVIGVLQSVINRRKIQCACLGAVFNLPMSTITIIEDALMIAMSGTMLLTLL